MTQAVHHDQLRRREWIDRVVALADQIKAWCKSQGWPVQENYKTIEEDLLGHYSVPELSISAPAGTLHFNPIALHVVGGNGRVDLEAFPSLSRVKLIGSEGGWTVMTDSNVPLREPWNEEAFVRLTADLTA